MSGSTKSLPWRGARAGPFPAPGLAGLARTTFGWIAGWWRCRRGVSAVEFALIAPVLGFSLIATVDLGRGLTERMAMDHALRSGAQRAMADPGEPKVLEVMRAAATVNFTLDDGQLAPGVNGIALSATRFCACPGNVGLAVTCSTVCSGSKPTFIFYRISAQKTYRGWLIPSMTFDRSAQVQIR